MTKTHHYRLVRVEPEAQDGAFATAAVLTCAACGQAISGMGGPGTDEVCADCGDEILRRRIVGQPLTGAALEAACLNAIADWKAPHEVAKAVGRGLTTAQAEAALKALVAKRWAHYGPGQNTYRAHRPGGTVD